MNNGKIEEPPLRYLSRSPLWMGISVAFTLLLAFLQYYLFATMNPLGFILLLPSVLLFFHTLWSLLHPYAGVYNDRIEIKSSLFYQKTLFFIDVAKSGLDKKGDLILHYKDGEEEKFRLFGLNKNDKPLLLGALSKSGL